MRYGEEKRKSEIIAKWSLQELTFTPEHVPNTQYEF